MEITVNSVNKPLIAAAYLTRYNWFSVATEDTTGKTSSFCATGIMIRDSGTLQFSRQFATPKISDGKIEEVLPVNESKFLFMDEGGTVYTVEATNKALANSETASGSKDDPASLIDWSRSYIDKAGNVFVTLDLRKLGVISNVEYSRIKSYMNVHLGGLSIKKQVCRTIYFCKEGQKIYAGLYNLETERPMTKVLFDDSGCYDIIYCEEDLVTVKKLRQMMQEAGDKLGEVIPQF